MKKKIFKMDRKSKFFFLSFICAFLITVNATESFSSKSNLVHVIQLDDATINPATADYIIQSIERAYEEKAQCLILKMDTPGGLLNSTRLIVKKIMSAPLPIVVFISPSGSRAGSAGVFITYSSHVAAMSPSTNIGAAHPVQMGGKKRDWWDDFRDFMKDSRQKQQPKCSRNLEEQKENGRKIIPLEDKKTPIESKEQSEEIPQEIRDNTEGDDDPLSSKILNDTVAFIKAIAEERNRNIDWAIKSVTKSLSITEQEALDKNVIEIIAKDDNDLLIQLDGRIVKIAGEERTLNTKDAFIKNIPMDFRQSFLNVLANPNIAYIFMILGFYGLLYEVTHPGFGVPGVLGTIFLILAFFSMQTLPVDYAGLALIILAIILFITEVNVPGFGLFTLGGVTCMFLGSMLLFDSADPMMRVSKSLVLSLSLTTAGITFIIVQAVLRSHRKKILSGKEGLVGQKGSVIKSIPLNQEGKVFVHGEIWNAVSDGKLEKGDKITVMQVDGMTLKVQKS